MKAMIALVLIGVVAMAAAQGLSNWNSAPGFRKTHEGYAAPYRNDARQAAVNRKAEYIGTGVGTYHYDGVPGSGNYFGYQGYGGGYGGYRGGYYGGYRGNGYAH